jgi:hypothetical protein
MVKLQKIGKKGLVSNSERSHSERASGAPIGAQDSNQSSEVWRSGYQDSGK